MNVQKEPGGPPAKRQRGTAVRAVRVDVHGGQGRGVEGAVSIELVDASAEYHGKVLGAAADVPVHPDVVDAVEAWAKAVRGGR